MYNVVRLLSEFSVKIRKTLPNILMERPKTKLEDSWQDRVETWRLVNCVEHNT